MAKDQSDFGAVAAEFSKLNKNMEGEISAQESLFDELSAISDSFTTNSFAKQAQSVGLISEAQPGEHSELLDQIRIGVDGIPLTFGQKFKDYFTNFGNIIKPFRSRAARLRAEAADDAQTAMQADIKDMANFMTGGGQARAEHELAVKRRALIFGKESKLSRTMMFDVLSPFKALMPKKKGSREAEAAEKAQNAATRGLEIQKDQLKALNIIAGIQSKEAAKDDDDKGGFLSNIFGKGGLGGVFGKGLKGIGKAIATSFATMASGIWTALKGAFTGPSAAKLAKFAGPAALIAGLFLAIKDGITGWVKSKDWGVSGISGVVGGFFGGMDEGVKGAFKGAGKWALIGMGIGSFIPVVGTVIGGLLGGVLGAVLGFIGGEKIAKFIDDIGAWVSFKWTQVKTSFETGLNKVMDWFKDLGVTIKEFFINDEKTGIIDWLGSLFTFDGTVAGTAAGITDVVLFLPNMVAKGVLAVGEWLLKLFGFDEAAEDVANAKKFSIGGLVVDAVTSIFTWFKDLLDIDWTSLISSVVPTAIKEAPGIGPVIKKALGEDAQSQLEGLGQVDKSVAQTLTAKEVSQAADPSSKTKLLMLQRTAKQLKKEMLASGADETERLKAYDKLLMRIQTLQGEKLAAAREAFRVAEMGNMPGAGTGVTVAAPITTDASIRNEQAVVRPKIRRGGGSVYSVSASEWGTFF